VYFYSLFVALGAQKWGQREPKAAQCGPKCSQKPARGPPKINSGASGGARALPGGLGVPPGSKSALKITFCTTWGICHETKKSTCSLSSVQQERARTSDIFLAVVFWVRVPLSQAVKEVTLHCSKSPQRGGWAKPLG